MKTMYYYYVLAVLWLVFSLNSCDTVESPGKIEERNRAATTAYLSNMYGEVMWLKKGITKIMLKK